MKHLLIVVLALNLIGASCEASISGSKPCKRTGAICEDGWVSHSKGRGTCSHHGGVKEWTCE